MRALFHLISLCSFASWSLSSHLKQAILQNRRTYHSPAPALRPSHHPHSHPYWRHPHCCDYLQARSLAFCPKFDDLSSSQNLEYLHPCKLVYRKFRTLANISSNINKAEVQPGSEAIVERQCKLRPAMPDTAQAQRTIPAATPYVASNHPCTGSLKRKSFGTNLLFVATLLRREPAARIFSDMWLWPGRFTMFAKNWSLWVGVCGFLIGLTEEVCGNEIGRASCRERVSRLV